MLSITIPQNFRTNDCVSWMQVLSYLFGKPGYKLYVSICTCNMTIKEEKDRQTKRDKESRNDREKKHTHTFQNMKAKLGLFFIKAIRALREAEIFQ